MYHAPILPARRGGRQEDLSEVALTFWVEGRRCVGEAKSRRKKICLADGNSTCQQFHNSARPNKKTVRGEDIKKLKKRDL